MQQIAYPCLCGGREHANVVASAEDVKQHLIDAHAHPGAIHSDRWRPADIDDQSKWPVRDLLTLDQVPVIGGEGLVHDALSPKHGAVQVHLNGDGTVRSVYKIEVGRDGREVTGEYVRFWDRQPFPLFAELKVTKRHIAER